MGPLSSLTSVTGGGGLQGGAGISETGDQIRGGGATFNFAPPPWLTQATGQQDTIKWVALAAMGLGFVWMSGRK